MALDLQGKLLPLPPAEFLSLDLAAQIEALRRNETPVAAHEKILTYAALLAETAMLYDFKDRADLADGARQMSLYAALGAVLEAPGDATARDLVERLTARLDPAGLHAPVADMLADFRARG